MLVLLVLLIATCIANAEVCRLNGCDDARSFHLDRAISPHLSVATIVSQPRLQCVANVNDFIVCTSGRGGPAWNKEAIPGLTAYSLDDGSMMWNSSEIFNTTAFAFSDLNGNTFASDGFIFIAVSPQGGLLGQPVIIAPVLGDLHSLAATHNQVFVLPSVASDVATYLSNGVPLGALWLNASFDGSEGTFVSSAPVVVRQDRFYMASRFQAVEPISSVACRLYAIDVNRVLVGKMIVAWYVNYTCPIQTNVIRSEATVLRSNNVLCYVAGTSHGQDQVQCDSDLETSSKRVATMSCDGTITSLALTDYNADVLLATCVHTNSSVTLLQLNLNSSSHASTALDGILPARLSSATMVPRCPMMTFNMSASETGIMLAFTEPSSNSTELVMLASSPAIRYVNSTVLPPDVGTCNQQLLAFDDRVALVTDSALVILERS
jgi:hypothetical protein